MLVMLVAFIVALSAATVARQRMLAGMALLGILTCCVLATPAPQNNVVDLYTTTRA